MARRHYHLALLLLLALISLYSTSYIFSRSMNWLTYDEPFPVLRPTANRTNPEKSVLSANDIGVVTVPVVIAQADQGSPRVVSIKENSRQGFPQQAQLNAVDGHNLNMDKSDKPKTVLYSRARTDRSGMAILDMLRAHAYVFQTNSTYGGACSRKPAPIHLERFSQEKSLLQSLGLHSLIRFACPPTFTSKGSISSSVHRVMNASEFGMIPIHYLFTPEWRQRVQLQMNAADTTNITSLFDKPSNTSPHLAVAVHIRRGDVDPCNLYFSVEEQRNISRYLPNSYYRRVLQRLVLNNNRGSAGTSPVVVTIYSETDSFEPWDDWTTDAMFTTNRTTKVALRLNTSLEEVWHGLRTADVVIMSKSAFSYVPALLNFQGQVIYYPLFYPPLPHWTIVDSDILNATLRELEVLQRNLSCYS